MANSGNFRHVYAAGVINHPVGLSRAGAPCHGQQSANQALKSVPAAGLWPGRRARGGVCVPSLLLEPLCCPREPGWHGPQGSTALQVTGSLTPPSHAGTPLVTGVQDANPALSEARSAGEGPSWLLSPPALRMAHVERWVDAAPAPLRCRIISGHLHRRTRRGVRGCEPCRGCGGGPGRAGSCGPGPFPLCPPSIPGLPGAVPRPDTAVLPLVAAGCERGASSAAPIIRGQLFCACDGSRRAPRARCPPPTWPASPRSCIQGEGSAGGSGALTQGSQRR